MAKVTFNKLGLKVDIPIKTIKWNEQVIEVKQHLTLEEICEMIADIVNSSLDENGYYNPCRLEMFASLNIIYKYTNITFTDKQKEDASKLYDAFYISGLLKIIMEALPEEELKNIHKAVKDIIESVYQYKNSILGILEQAKQNYNDTNFSFDNIQEVLKNNGEDFGFLKEVLSKMG